MKRLVNFRPIYFIVFGFINGILLAYFSYTFTTIKLGVTIAINLVAIATLSLLYVYKRSFNRRLAFCLVGYLLFLAIGGFSIFQVTDSFDKAFVEEKRYLGEGKVVSFSIDKNVNSRMILDDVVLLDGNKETKLKYKVYAFTDFKYDFEFGERVIFDGEIENLNLKEDGETIYSYYLFKDIKYTTNLSIYDVNFSPSDEGFFDTIRNKVKRIVYKNLDESVAPTALALLIGSTGDMEQTELDGYRFSGIAHIFSVSGLHIGFMYIIFDFLLKRTPLPSVIKMIIISASLIFYAGLCFFVYPAIRAVIMCIIAMVFKEFGEKNDSVTSTLLAYTICLLLNPYNLFDVGTIMSFVVALAIMIMMPYFQRKFSKLPDSLNSSLSMSITAFLSITPIGMIYFGYGSVISMLLNLLLVPLVSAIYGMLLFVVTFSLIFGGIRILFLIPELLIRFTRDFTLAIPWEKIMITSIDLDLSVLFYYASLLVLVDFVNLKGKRKWITFISLNCVFVTLTIINNLT